MLKTGIKGICVNKGVKGVGVTNRGKAFRFKEQV